MSSGHVSVGHPVDVGTGAVFTFCHDFRIPGAFELLWRRYYSTVVEGSSWLGRKWTVPYFTHLQHRASRYVLNGAHGEQVYFGAVEPLTVGASVSNFGSNMELRRESNQYSVLHWHHGGEFRRFCFSAELVNERFPLTSIGNLAGHKVLVEYDRAGRPATLVQELEGRLYEITYDSADLISAIFYCGQSQRKRLVDYEYDQLGRLSKASDAMGHSTAYEYDLEGRMTAETSPSGSRFLFEYDWKGRCIRTAGSDGYLERKLRYSSAPLMTKVTDTRSGVTQYFLNTAGQVVQVVKPLGAVTTNTFDEHGRLTCVTRPDGSQESRSYDDRGNLAKISDACGNTTSFEHDDRHVRTRITDRNGYAWIPPNRYEGSVADVRDLPKRLWEYKFDRRGLAIQARSLAGWTIQIQRDANFRWQQRRDEISVLQLKYFDELGRVVQITDSRGVVSSTTYDDLHRIREISRGASDVTRYEWNAIEKMTGRFGPGNQSEKWEYDRYGNLLSHTDALGQAVQNEYDLEGELVAITNRIGERLEYKRDLQGRIVEERLFDGRIQRYEYDTADRQTAIHCSDDRKIDQVFDSAGRLVRRSASDGLVDHLQYDKEGRVIKAWNSHTCVEINRDRFGRVLRETQNGRSITYRHDLDGNCLMRMLPFEVTGCKLLLTVDSRGRLVSLRDEMGVCQQLHWDDSDRLSERSSPGGLVEKFDYDRDRNLSQHRVEGPGGSLTATYTYDSNGNLHEFFQTGDGSLLYSYDALDRVREVRREGVVTEAYDYDQNNSIHETHRGRRSLAPAGKALADGSRTITYSPDGAIASIRSHGKTWLLTHDVNSRLVKIEITPENPIRYEYDPLGRRVAKIINGDRTEFLWDGQSLLAEIGSGKASTIYLSVDLRPFAYWKGGDRYTPVVDRRGTVQRVYDEHRLRWKGTLDSYGNVLSSTGDIPSPFRLRGQYYDAESGFHYNFNRYYDPLLGDFTAPDPIGIRGGLHLYAYPRNPLRWDDPFGLRCGIPENHEDDDEPPGLPRLGDQQGQAIVNDIHAALGADSIAAQMSTTTLTETENGTLIVTNSTSVTPAMRQRIDDMQEPGGPLEGRNVLIPSDATRPEHIVPDQQNLPPQGPNNTPTGAENHGEQKGIQAANLLGEGPAETQWSRSNAGHQGQACPDCAAAQQQNNVRNPTGVDPNPH